MGYTLEMRSRSSELWKAGCGDRL